MTGETTDFLYPFIDAGESDPGALLADLAASAAAKAGASRQLQRHTLTRCRPQLQELAGALARRFEAGGRLYTFGNGGSSTDAAAAAQLFTTPPWGRPLPARCLVGDDATLTAIGNDVGFDLVFSRQLIAFGNGNDMAMGFSTSGSSPNVLHAMAEARRRGMLTAGIAGYQGGQMAASADVAHCLVVESDSVHRIQESQGALLVALWCDVQGHLGAARAGAGADGRPGRAGEPVSPPPGLVDR